VKVTYVEYVLKELKIEQIGAPIYTGKIAKKMQKAFNLGPKAAAAATAVAFKRILDGKAMPDLRFYQKGIYYRTVETPFGERRIDKEQLIADKYLLPDMGYETGPALLHRMGLTTQMPRGRLLATNVAKDCMRTDKKLGVLVRPPKVKVTAGNKAYLQTLDVLDMMKGTPVDEKHPYLVVARHIEKHKLRYDVLLSLAGNYYNRRTVLELAHTASAGGIRL
jgi:hypothetical protein